MHITRNSTARAASVKLSFYFTKNDEERGAEKKNAETRIKNKKKHTLSAQNIQS